MRIDKGARDEWTRHEDEQRAIDQEKSGDGLADDGIITHIFPPIH